jgi:hypothetical protein
MKKLRRNKKDYVKVAGTPLQSQKKKGTKAKTMGL